MARGSRWGIGSRQALHRDMFYHFPLILIYELQLLETKSLVSKKLIGTLFIEGGFEVLWEHFIL